MKILFITGFSLLILGLLLKIYFIIADIYLYTLIPIFRQRKLDKMIRKIDERLKKKEW